MLYTAFMVRWDRLLSGLVLGVCQPDEGSDATCVFIGRLSLLRSPSSFWTPGQWAPDTEPRPTVHMCLALSRSSLGCRMLTTPTHLSGTTCFYLSTCSSPCSGTYGAPHDTPQAGSDCCAGASFDRR